MRLLIVGLLASAVHMLASPADEVDPFIGTGRAGNCYPGAQAPFGMISWSPNTYFEDRASDESRPGYKYSKREIIGFSLAHLSGVGCHAAQDLPVMAVTGDPIQSPVANPAAYKSLFSHDNEQARPGYYSVRLDDGGIQVELSVTERCGIGRLQYTAGTPRQSLVFRPTDSANGVSACQLKIDPAGKRLSGVLSSGGFCSRDPRVNDYRLFFVFEFNRAFISHGMWRGADRMLAARELNDPKAAAWLSFDGKEGNAVLMRVGLSYVSEANALQNLRTEIPDWDLDKVRNQTRQAWERQLSVLEVQASPETKALLYTALYHNFLQPSIIDDTNGEYPGFDDKIRKVAPGRHKYVNFSNWDTYRTTAPLLGLLAPDRASDMVNSLLLDAQEGAPRGIPNWGYFNNEADVMPGYSGIPFIANAVAFGARDTDLAAAKDALVKAADTRYRGGAEYLKLGYVPSAGGEHDYSVSETAEYSIADYCVAELSSLAGDEATAERFRRRSLNVFKLFDPGTGYLHPRTADGGWVQPFEPTATRGFTEGNSTQYTWGVPHAMAALMKRIGSRAEAETRLDDFLSKILVEGWNTGAPYFWLSNEPCFGVPMAYYWLGKPAKTQEAMARILKHFKEGPDGLPGDDDVGAMSAYYIFGALGLYPGIPGMGGFLLTGSTVEKAVLKLAGGKQELVISSTGAQGEGRYIKTVRLNGAKWRSPWLPLSSFSAEGKTELSIEYATDAGVWGSREADQPPSLKE